jgi:hypothetical protein
MTSFEVFVALTLVPSGNLSRRGLKAKAQQRQKHRVIPAQAGIQF